VTLITDSSTSTTNLTDAFSFIYFGTSDDEYFENLIFSDTSQEGKWYVWVTAWTEDRDSVASEEYSVAIYVQDTTTVVPNVAPVFIEEVQAYISFTLDNITSDTESRYQLPEILDMN
jgi:hypothetical protein